MAAPSIEEIYEFSLIQIAAESYIERTSNFDDVDFVRTSLLTGTNRFGYKKEEVDEDGNPVLNQGWPGFTRMTTPQFDEFYSKFQIIHQWSDNPSTGDPQGYRPAPDMAHTAGLILNGDDMLANTGFSATLVQRRGTNEYTLALRSTESREWEDGGDSERDMEDTDKNGVVMTGFALAQLDAMEKYYEWLKVNQLLPQGALLNVTGYSLGGHLATIFTEMHRNDPWLGGWGDTVTFNGAGRGTWDGSVGNEADMLAYYRQVLLDPDSAGVDFSTCSIVDLVRTGAWLAVAGFTTLDIGLFGTAEGVVALGLIQGRAEEVAGDPFDPKSIYEDPRYGWAVAATMLKFDISPQLPGAEHGSLADDLITQVYGHENINNVNFTANSQNNGSEYRVGIESQPLLDRLGGVAFDYGDYGFGHSIVLISDSLALQRAIRDLDSVFNADFFINMLPRLSARDTQNFIGTNYEYDLLENVLDGLRFAIQGQDSKPTPIFTGPGGFGDWDSRNTYHANLKTLTDSEAYQALCGKVRFCLADFTQREVARNDFSAFLGLYTLSPVYLRALPGEEAAVAEALAAVWPELHAEWLADREASVPAHFSEHWLEDRRDFLAGQLQVNQENAADAITRDPAGIEGVRFHDAAWSREVTVLAANDDEVRRHVLFDARMPTAALVGSALNDRLYASSAGSELQGEAGDDELEGRSGADLLLGGDGVDILRGMAGDDVLRGGAGRDRLEGGLGHDEYRIDTGDGFDTLFDLDGKGWVYIDGTMLGGGVHETPNSWRSEDGRFRYVLEILSDGRQRLLVQPLQGNRGESLTQLLIEDFRPGMFGIELPGAPTPEQGAAGPILGDIEPDWLYQLNADGSESRHLHWDALGNIVGTPGVTPRPDLLMGGTGNDVIRGGFDNDSLYGKDGNDRLEGELGNDLLGGGLGRDIAIGGDGDDMLFGDSSPAWQDLRARLEVVPSDSRPPVEGASFHDAGIDWIRFTADVARLAPTSHSNPDAMTPVLQQMDPVRFGTTRLLAAELSSFTPVEGGDDVLVAGAGNDLLRGEGGHDRLAGDAGSDRLAGGAGNDHLDGGDDDDLLLGDGILYAAFRWNTLDLGGDYRATSEVELYEDEYGNDILRGGAGADYLFGMAGADSLHGEAGNDVLVGDFQEVVAIPVLRLSDDGSTVALDTSEHFDEAVRHHGDDFLDGGDGDDYLIGLAGDDELFGGAGADVLMADGNPHEVQGRYGDDLLDGEAGDDFLVGSGGDDVVRGGDGHDVLWGDEYAGSNGVFMTQWGAIQLAAGEAVDALAQELHGRDTLDAGAGNDTLTGGGRDDVLRGGSGDDQLFGDGIGVTQEGNDRLYGGSGSDELQGNGGDDLLMGEQGADRLYGQAGADRLDGGADGDYLDGGDGEDRLSGGDANDTLFGGAEDDNLAGGTGDDQLSGDDGNDSLEGGLGRDYLAGGQGDDTYVLRAGDGEVIDNTFEMIVEAGGSDTLRFLGVDPAGITVRNAAVAGDLALQYGAGDGVYLAGGLSGAIERVQFGDAEAISFADFLLDRMSDPMTQQVQTAGVSFGGGKAADQLATLDNNTVTGGGGNDVIEVYGGDNTIVMRQGDGLDRVRFWEQPLLANRVRFGPGISPEDLQIFPAPYSYSTRLNIRISGDAGNGLVFEGFDPAAPLAFKAVLGYFDFTRDDGSVYTLTYEEMLSNGFSYPVTEGADVIVGTALDEAIDGMGGNDQLDGGGGNDVLAGGAGNDSVHGGHGDDILSGGVDNDYLYGGAGSDLYVFAPGDGVDTVDVTDAGDVVALAYTSADIIFRNRADALVMSFRDSADEIRVPSYFLNTGDSAAATLDILSADGVHFGYAAVLAAALAGGEGDDLIVGTQQDDLISGGAGNDLLAGGRGNDTLDGGAGDDTLSLEEGDDTYVFGVGSGHDWLQPTSWAHSSWGVGNDTILMLDLAPSQVLATRIDADHMALKIRASDDWIAFSPSAPGFADLQVRFADGTRWASADLLALAPLTEGDDQLVLMETDDYLGMLGGNDTVEARGGQDWIWGEGGNDTLRGGDGDDTLYGGSGDDTLDGGAGRDQLFGEDGADRLLGGEGDDRLEDGSGADVLDGGDGMDLLYAMEADNARDTLSGGAGNDDHFIAEALDVVVEADGGGFDSLTYMRGGTYSIPLWVEQVRFAPGVNPTAIKITGNVQDNIFDVGYSLQRDTLVGGAGNDTYLYVDALDVITEARSGGVDTVYFRGTSYSLGSSNIENAYICRPGGNVLTVQAWTLTGNAAANILRIEDGFALNASGGDGNDTLIGCGNGYGIFDRLEGGNGNDELDGRGGADTLVGGAGNDTYHVYSNEVLIESTKGGVDTVIAHIDFSLVAAGSSFENLTLNEHGSVLRGWGNAIANRLTGNSFDNVLDGGDGADTLFGKEGSDTLIGGIGIDTLVGGAGDDTYVVDNTGDIVQESASEGVDAVRAAVSYTLGVHVENLALTGSANINGTGNGLANQLRGNAGANTLTGLGGNDTYRFGRGSGADTIVDSDSSAGNADVLLFDAGVARDQLWFRQSGSGLEVAILGGGDKVIVSNWYGGASNHVERIQLADGSFLLDGQVELLVQAMAGMTPPPAGQSALSPDQFLALEGVLASTWQSA